MIEQFAEHVPPELKSISGAVFFSGRDAFTGPKDLYVLGLNPGGDPIKQRRKTISRHTDGVLHHKPDLWSEYTCESWAPNEEPGEGRFQRNVIHLIRKLGYDPRDVPASNVIFSRSRRIESLESRGPDSLFEACWPFHREVISIIQPRLIVCIGKTFREHLQCKTKTEPIDSFKKSYGRSYQTEVFQNERGCGLAFVWHLSWGPDLTKEESDPSGVFRQVLKRAKVRWSSSDLC